MKVHLIRVGPVVLLAVAASSAASAAESDGAQPHLSLERARGIAAERAPSILAARAWAGVAVGDVEDASVLVRFNPQLSAGVSARRSNAGTSPDVDVSLSQRFEIGGQRGDRIDRAQADANRSEALSRDELRHVLYEVSVAFVRVQHAEASLAVRTHSASIARSLLDTARRRHEVGEIGGLDVNVATVTNARTTAAKDRSAAGRAQSLGRLRGLLGFEPEANVVVDDRFRELADVSLAMLNDKLDSRADLEALRFAGLSAKAEAALGRAERWPDVGLFVRYGREEDANIAGGGLSITLPIFARGQGHRARGASRARAVDLELEARRRALRAELAGRVEAYGHLVDAVRAYQTDALPRLLDNLELGRQAYQAGAIPIGEFLSIQREMVSARMSYVDLLLEAHLAVFEIEYQAGGQP